MNISIPYYDEKLTLYKISAEKPTVPGPPESKWYGLWNAELQKISFNQRYLLVFPQYDFRFQTANSVPSISHSTRYTDFALMDNLPNNHNDPNLELESLATKLLILLEVKPPPEDPCLRDRAFANAKSSLQDQLKHHFLAQERHSAVKVITIAAVGHEWQWNVYQRVGGTTPASESNRAAVPFKEEHQFIVAPAFIEGRAPGWSEIAALRTHASTLEF